MAFASWQWSLDGSLQPHTPPSHVPLPSHLLLLQDSQLCGLNVLSSLGAGSDTVSAQLLNPGILSRLHYLIQKGEGWKQGYRE